MNSDFQIDGNQAQAPAVEPFPVHIFPPGLARYVEEAANAIGCPKDYIGASILTIAASAIGAGALLEIKKGWVEGATVFCGLVGEPGDKKSPALREVASPLFDHQRTLSDTYKRAKDVYEAEKAVYDVRLTAWKSACRQAQQEPLPEAPRQPNAPTRQRLFTTDVTMEAVALILRDNPNGILLYRDELTGWVRSMDQYRGGRGADRQNWLSIWTRSPIAVDRKQAEPILVENPTLCVLGGIQPDVLNELVDSKGREDGFIHRILFTFPLPVRTGWTEATISDEARAAWRETFLALAPSQARTGNDTGLRLTFDNEGKHAWIEFENKHYEELYGDSLPPHLHGPWIKLEAYCARLALVLQLIASPGAAAVGKEAVEGAKALIAYFKNHCVRVYHHLQSDPPRTKATKVMRWIEKFGGECTASDLVTNGVAGIQRSDEASTVLNDLAGRGFGVLEPRKPARGPSYNVFVLSLEATQ